MLGEDKTGVEDALQASSLYGRKRARWINLTCGIGSEAHQSALEGKLVAHAQEGDTDQ